MAVADSEVDAEPVPGFAMPIFQVSFEARTLVAGESDIVELAAAVEGVDSVPQANVVSNVGLVLLENVPQDVLEVLADKRGSATLQNGFDRNRISQAAEVGSGQRVPGLVALRKVSAK